MTKKRTTTKPAAEAATPKAPPVTNLDVEAAYRALDSDLMFFFPRRTFMASEHTPEDGTADVFGFAVTGTEADHEGWRGPTVIVGCCHADAGSHEGDPDKSSVVVSGRDALEQLRAAIDFALARGETKP